MNILFYLLEILASNSILRRIVDHQSREARAPFRISSDEPLTSSKAELFSFFYNCLPQYAVHEHEQISAREATPCMRLPTTTDTQVFMNSFKDDEEAQIRSLFDDHAERRLHLQRQL